MIKPILFNTEMVKAILGGRKTVTRRIISEKVKDNLESRFWDCERSNKFCKYKVGDILWVRETFGNYGDGTQILYKADFPNGAKKYIHDDKIHICDIPKWRPSIHMPKSASRIFLKVTDVRVEKLNDMSIQDMINEGISTNGIITTDGPIKYRVINRFEELWDSTTKEEQYKFASNPYVWVIEFERCEKPEDF